MCKKEIRRIRARLGRIDGSSCGLNLDIGWFNGRQKRLRRRRMMDEWEWMHFNFVFVAGEEQTFYIPIPSLHFPSRILQRCRANSITPPPGLRFAGGPCFFTHTAGRHTKLLITYTQIKALDRSSRLRAVSKNLPKGDHKASYNYDRLGSAEK